VIPRRSRSDAAGHAPVHSIGASRRAPQVSTWPSERSRNGGVDEIPLPTGHRGRLWLCGKRFVGPDPEAALHQVGASTVVCLSEAAELADRYPDYVTWLQTSPPDRALWYPIADLHAPDLLHAEELWAELRARLAADQGLLMHCGAGIGRAGTIATGLLMTLGVAPEAAVAHVGAHRPMAGPEVGTQERLLQKLAARAGLAGEHRRST
jgi:protein-tyrosine phosphatase